MTDERAEEARRATARRKEQQRKREREATAKTPPRSDRHVLHSHLRDLKRGEEDDWLDL